MAAARRRVAPGAQALLSVVLLGPRVARPPPAPPAKLLGPRAAPAVARPPPAPPAAFLKGPRAASLLGGRPSLAPALLHSPRAPPPPGGRLAPAPALLHGPRAPPPPGGRPAPAPALLHGPRAPPPPRAAALLSPRVLCLLPATAPLAAALGPHRHLSTGASVQPGRDGGGNNDAKRAAAADTARTDAVDTGYATDAAAAAGSKTTSLVVDMSGRGGVNSKVLTRDTKLPGEDEVPTAAKAASGGVLEKAGAFNLGARSALAAPLLDLDPRFSCLRLLQPTTPLPAARGGLLRFSTGAATILPNGDARDASAAPNCSKRGAGDTNSAGKEEPKHAATDTTRADGENIDSAKTKPSGSGGFGNSGDPRVSSSDGEGHDKTRGGRIAEEVVLDKVREMLKTSEEVVLDKAREMLEEHSEKERTREVTRAAVQGQIFVWEVVFILLIGVIYFVKIYHEKTAIILDGKKGQLEEV
ncbi:unnamed protein product [Urochloa humidicola]